MPKRTSTESTQAEETPEAVAPEGTVPPEVPDETAALVKERDELKEQLMRSMAEFQNFRRRAQTEKEQLRQFAVENLLVELLPVLDNFERTTAALSSGAPIEAVTEGVQAVERQLRAVLDGRKLVRIPAKGLAFDPALHEAVVTEDSLWFEDGTVLEELEPGYQLHDRVIRPAKVKVSRKP